MQIKLYQCNDDNTMIPKHMTLKHTLTGSVRGSVDVERPSIIIEMPSNLDFNYLYAEDFGRYYYIEERNVVRTDLLQLICRCDVLQSFYPEFIHCPIIAERSSSAYNRFLPDAKRAVEQRPINQYIHIGEFSGKFGCILVTVG